MQGSELLKELRDEACCIFKWFVTTIYQYFVVLGDTDCTYPFGPLYSEYSLNNKALTFSMHVQDVSWTASRLIYILMQEDTFSNTNKPLCHVELHVLWLFPVCRSVQTLYRATPTHKNRARTLPASIILVSQ